MTCKLCGLQLPLRRPNGERSELWECRNCGTINRGFLEEAAREAIRHNCRPFHPELASQRPSLDWLRQALLGSLL